MEPLDEPLDVDELIATHRQKIDAMIGLVLNLTEEEDDIYLLRYLLSNDLDVEKSVTEISKGMQWRKDNVELLRRAKVSTFR